MVFIVKHFLCAVRVHEPKSVSGKTGHALILARNVKIMEIVFLGNWSAKTLPGKINTSFVIDGNIACDFGPSSLQAMLEKGLDPNRLERVLISHLHYDHYSGLIGLLWYRAMSGNEDELVITGPEGIEERSRKLLELYNTPQGFHIYASFQENTGKNVEIFSGEHTVPDNAYRIKHENRIIFYSGDTVYSENIVNGADKADLLIHEMTYTDDLKIEAELWKHSTVSDAISVFMQSGAKRLIPVHLTAETQKAITKLQKEYEQLFIPDDSIIL